MKMVTWLAAMSIGSTLFFAGFVGAGFLAVSVANVILIASLRAK